VEIVMALEEKFNISVEESDAQNITTIQEAADLIEDLVQKKPAAETSWTGCLFFPDLFLPSERFITVY